LAITIKTMKNTAILLLATASLLLPFSCGNAIPSSEAIPAKSVDSNPNFKAYWYDGKAEITSFKLTQARYGELREGTAVMVFVTEPFSKSKHVKMDDPSSAPEDQLDVLKLNFTKNFNTGIYPYSILTSCFTPANGDKSVKINSSCQEWCGHTFFELDLVGKDYNWTLNSYFEEEHGQKGKMPDAIAEDEIWNMIRINPEALPTGDILMIPSLSFLRFKHIDAKGYNATGSLGLKEGLKVYKIDYAELKRSIEIYFESGFPFNIIGWSETYPDGWSANAPLLTSSGTLMKSIRTDYWNRNGNADSGLRKELDLE